MGIVKSGMYSLMSTAGTMLFNILGMVVLGRLLSPEDFGLYAVVLAVHTIFLPFLDMGLMPAYVKLEEVDIKKNTAFFFLNTLLGALIGLLIILLSPLVASYYANEVLFWLLLVHAVSVIFSGLGNQSYSQLVRKQNFKGVMVVNLTSSFLALVGAVIFAWYGFGYWSLVFKSVIFAIIRYIGMFLVVRPSYQMIGLDDLRSIKDSIVFGAQLTMSRMIYGYTLAFDKFIVGKFFTIESLGFYERGLRVTSIPDNVRAAVSTPVISYFARMNKGKAADFYDMMSFMLIIIAGLPCVFLFVEGKWITIFLLGEKWETCGELVRWLSFYGVAKILKGIVNIIHINEMDAKKLLRINIVELFALYGIIFLCYALIEFDLSLFVKIFSGITLIFWNGCLIMTINRYSPKKSAGYYVFYEISLILFAAFLSNFLVDILYINFGFRNVCLSFIVFVLVEFLILLALDFKRINSIFLLIKKRN